MLEQWQHVSPFSRSALTARQRPDVSGSCLADQTFTMSRSSKTSMRRSFLLLGLLLSGCFFGYRQGDSGHPVPPVRRGAVARGMVLTGQVDAARGAMIGGASR